MATKDANGALHGERDGKFVSKGGNGTSTRSEMDRAMAALDEAEKPRRVEGTDIVLSKQEYVTLRAEVMRKNVTQKKKSGRTEHAFTANYFYSYKTTGYDEFTVTEQIEIEGNEDFIDDLLKNRGNKDGNRKGT